MATTIISDGAGGRLVLAPPHYTASAIVEQAVVPKTPLDIVVNLTVSTNTLTNVWSYTIPNNCAITNISIAPTTANTLLQFFINYGRFAIGSSSNDPKGNPQKVALYNTVFNRDFPSPHLPIVEAGQQITLYAQSAVSQVISISISGFYL